MKYMQNVPSKCITRLDNKQYFWIYDYCMQIVFAWFNFGPTITTTTTINFSTKLKRVEPNSWQVYVRENWGGGR